MRETALVVGLVLLMILVGVARAIPWPLLLGWGQRVMYTAAGVGIPLELVYFAALRGALQHAGDVPPGWYWRSFEHHHRIGPLARWFVLPPFYLGALAFLGIVIGIAIVILALVMAVGS